MSPRIEGRITSTLDRLSERDKLVLSLVGRFRLLTALQLQALCFEPGQDRLRRRALARLVELGALETLVRRIGGVRSGSVGFVFQFGVDGQRLLALLSERDGIEPPRRLREPGGRFVTHTRSPLPTCTFACTPKRLPDTCNSTPSTLSRRHGAASSAWVAAGVRSSRMPSPSP